MIPQLQRTPGMQGRRSRVARICSGLIPKDKGNQDRETKKQHARSFSHAEAAADTACNGQIERWSCNKSRQSNCTTNLPNHFSVLHDCRRQTLVAKLLVHVIFVQLCPECVDLSAGKPRLATTRRHVFLQYTRKQQQEDT